jgi:hypothetical protein
MLRLGIQIFDQKQRLELLTSRISINFIGRQHKERPLF